MSVRHKSALALIVGALSVFTYAPFAVADMSLGWLAPVPLAFLFYAWLTAPGRKQAFWLGWCYGLGAFLAGVHWIYVSLSVYGGMPAPLAVIGTILLAAYLALFPALAGVLSYHVKLPRWLRVCFFMPLAWVMTEWLRGYLFTGFPWLAVGYTQTDTPIAGWTPVGGVFLASWWVGVLAGCLLLMCLRHGNLRTQLVVIGLVFLSGLGLKQIAWTEALGKPLPVSLLQGNIPQDLKWNPAFARQSLDTYATLVQASRGKLIVLPETALPLIYQQAERNIPGFLAGLRQEARERQAGLLLGTPEQGARWDIYYNSAVLMQGSKPDQWYRKVHLVPLGEYLPGKPFSTWLLDMLHIPLGEMASGLPRQPLMTLGEQTLAVNICYEDVFGGELTRAGGKASILVNMSNLAWFGHTVALDQHLQIARVRALENGRPMIRSTNTGATAAIAADGRLIGMLPYFTANSLEVQVQGMQGETPYQRFGAAWIWLLLALAGGMCWRQRSA
ncbi:apolipoprotein N-acyltransferase [Leeia oryzae]|uniref:apolipoprotein N-acyltransferase n=1 Tax=Leeia oryzae TaxID=356662 RepID=UPI0014613C25|nr:apolipoprotein N-acyltransferase [Leeia oryzae]